MKKRNPIAVALLSFVTFGIYGIYWLVVTKSEMNKLGAEIPSALLIIIPIVDIWWLWKYCEGVQKVTGDKLNGVLAFVLLWLLGPIGGAIVQDSFNNVSSGAAAPAGPVAPAPIDSSLETETPPPADQPPTNPVQ